MALINLQQVLGEALKIITRADISSGVELLSYKRNRSIALIRQSEHSVRIIEKGYIEQDSLVDLDKLAKILKTLLKREFPRSRKVRVIKLASEDELKREKQQI